MILFFCTSFGFAFFVEFLKFLELFGAFIKRLLPLDEHGVPYVLLNTLTRLCSLHVYASRLFDNEFERFFCEPKAALNDTW